MRYAPILDFLEVLAQPVEDFLALRIAELVPEFFQREMDDVVVMNLLGRNVAAELQPDAVQQIDLLRREVRRMRAQIENVFLAAGEIDLEGSVAVWDRITAPRPGRRCALLR